MFRNLSVTCTVFMALCAAMLVSDAVDHKWWACVFDTVLLGYWVWLAKDKREGGNLSIKFSIERD